MAKCDRCGEEWEDCDCEEDEVGALLDDLAAVRGELQAAYQEIAWLRNNDISKAGDEMYAEDRMNTYRKLKAAQGKCDLYESIIDNITLAVHLSSFGEGEAISKIAALLSELKDALEAKLQGVTLGEVER